MVTQWKGLVLAHDGEPGERPVCKGRRGQDHGRPSGPTTARVDAVLTARRNHRRVLSRRVTLQNRVFYKLSWLQGDHQEDDKEAFQEPGSGNYDHSG